MRNVLLAIVLSLAWICVAWAGSDAMIQSVAVGAAPTLVVDGAGDIRIVKSADGQIRAMGKLTAIGSSSPGDGAFRLIAAPTGARIETRHKPGKFRLELVIEVPAKSSVVIDALDGSLAIEGLDGRIRGDFRAGRVRIVDHGGDVDLKIKEGQVDLQLPRSAKQAVRIALKRGQVSADISAESTGSGLISVKEGSVDFRVGDRAKLALEALVEKSGRVSVDQPITQPEPASVYFTTRGGGAAWTLHVVTGDIRIGVPGPGKKKQP
ncbi:MAG: hypothetical protein IT350_01170 [Deltaproteobacteria bacterium]|nr:hypothetical protein [Deltaproteobacteria bacterium]